MSTTRRFETRGAAALLTMRVLEVLILRSALFASKDGTIAWFETAQARLLTMRVLEILILRSGLRLEGWNDRMVRDGASAPPHHEGFGSPQPEERALRARLEGWNNRMVRDGANAPPHHEG
jgi:hypothetical protein